MICASKRVNHESEHVGGSAGPPPYLSCDRTRTAALSGAAQREGDFGHVRSSTGTTSEQLQMALSAAREHLSSDRFETTLAAGREMTLDIPQPSQREHTHELRAVFCECSQAVSCGVEVVHGNPNRGGQDQHGLRS